MTDTVTETFFRPDEVGRESTSIPADIYNLMHTILARSENTCVFVPIRALQYLGVLTEDETVFVDSMAYIVNEGHGGRVIKLAWEFGDEHTRDSLQKPIACDVIYYHDDGVELQKRLIIEFRDALKLMDKRYREHVLPKSGARILNMSQ